jgi:hypothetical protein
VGFALKNIPRLRELKVSTAAGIIPLVWRRLGWKDVPLEGAACRRFT